MKAPFSAWLDRCAPVLRGMIGRLREEYDYVSILSTDSVGFSLNLSQKSKSVSGETMTTERGNVVRVCRGGQYSEYAFNDWDPEHPERSPYGGSVVNSFCHAWSCTPAYIIEKYLLK